MPETPNIELRSDEVQEIMSHVPNWMIRWGISLILGILFMLLFLAWLIKYPDVIEGQATLTTIEQPIKLLVKSAGEIEQIHALDNKNVTKNELIATIKSTLSDEAHLFLNDEVLEIRKRHESKTLEKTKLRETNLVFGELQANYNSLANALKNYANLVNQNNTAFNISNTSKQIANQKSLYNLNVKQLQQANKLLQNAESKFKSDKILAEKGVISQSEFYERERAYESAVSEIQNSERNKIQASISITELEKVLNEYKFNYEQQKKTVLLEIETNLQAIENALATWNRNYQLIAPINGKLSYLQSIVPNQFIEQGKELFAVIPENQDFIAHLKIAKGGFGKVKPNQKVIMKLDNFPSHEFGQVIGVVQSISLIPKEESYLVKVKLTQGLLSTYKKELKYTPEMTGSAEIITEDLRITDRIFNQLRKILK